MKILRVLDCNHRIRYGTDLREQTVEILDGDLFEGLGTTGQRTQIAALLAPVEPVNIFGIGLNYRDSLRQMGAQEPDQPAVFMKPTTAIANPFDPIRLPDSCRNGPEVDFEVELAVVIGRAVRDVSPSQSMSYVFGYTIANDITARKWTKKSQTRGKGFDSFCPLGPALVTADEIADPQGLVLRSRLNGQLMQESNTREMIFPVADLVSYLSQDTTLLPGTLILTGTPAGSGFTKTPPRFLDIGDEVEVEVEGMGRLSNTLAGDGLSASRSLGGLQSRR